MEIPDVAVIAPCFNEAYNVAELARRVLNAFDNATFDGELILVNDGSHDGTREAIDALAAAHPGRIIAKHHDRNRGIAAGWKTGVGAARAPIVAIIDADLQYQPEDLIRMYRELHEHSVDIVQGWRSAVGRDKNERFRLSRTFNFLLNSSFGMKLEDNKSGFLMCAKEVLEDLLTYRGNYHFWQSFVMVAAHAKGYTYKQIQVLFEDRRQGTSFLEGATFSASARSVADLTKAVWEYRLKRHSPDVQQQFLRRHGVVDRSKPMTAPRRALWRAYMASFERTHWMITRDVERYYESLRSTQWLSLEQMRQLQNEKLRRLVRHAYRNVPYYRTRMQEAGLRPQDIRSQVDLHKLPFVTKEDVRRHLYFDILSENHDKREILRISTSGSTGEPFVCFADRAQLEFRWAATLRSQEWTGYEFGDRSVRLWHQTLGMNDKEAAKERLDAVMLRRKFIPVFEMNDASLRRMVKSIADWRPVLMDGYAEALDFLAHYLKEHGEIPVRPKALMSSAQTLPATSRQRIEEAFGCKVFDKYGAREFSGIAYECQQHRGHHVVAEGYIVEILRDGEPVRPGEVGEVVITDLNNYCLPFIRYRIGDLAVAVDPDEQCPCGRGMPLIGDIQGRVQSIIQGTDGRYLPGTFFAHYLKEFDHAISQFQVVQTQRGHVDFRIVKGGRYSDSVLSEVVSTFRRYLGDDMRIDVEFVNNVDLIRTGKRLATISHLGFDFQNGAPGRVAI